MVGTGSNVVIQQTCPGARVLEHHRAGLLSLVDVTITGGSFTGASAAEVAQGGGVRADGDVRLERAILRSNTVTGAPGAQSGPTATNAGVARGGRRLPDRDGSSQGLNLVDITGTISSSGWDCQIECFATSPSPPENRRALNSS